MPINPAAHADDVKTPAADVQNPVQMNMDLISRVAFGRAVDVEYLLQRGADPRAVNKAGMPAILIAVMNRNTNDVEVAGMVKSLLAAGADPNTMGPNGEILLAEAVKHSNPDVIRIITANENAVVNVRDKSKYTIVQLAEATKNEEMIKVVKEALLVEDTRWAQLKNGENLGKLVKQYSFSNCANAYLNYYIGMETGKKIDTETFQRVIKANEMEIAQVELKINKIFSVSKADLRMVRENSRGAVLEELEFFLTDKNRIYNGIGSDKDLNKRCKKIADKWSSKVAKEKTIPLS